MGRADAKSCERGCPITALYAVEPVYREASASFHFRARSHFACAMYKIEVEHGSWHSNTSRTPRDSKVMHCTDIDYYTFSVVPVPRHGI